MSVKSFKNTVVSVLLAGATFFGPVASSALGAEVPSSPAAIAEQTAYAACMKRVTDVRDQRRGDMMAAEHIPAGGNSAAYGPLLELKDALESDYHRTVNLLDPDNGSCSAQKRPATMKALDAMIGVGPRGAN